MAEKLPAFTDPTMAFMQFLTGLGGTKTSGSSTTTSGADPAAIAALNKILGEQMNLSTPEGIQGVMAKLFQQAGEQMPGISMQFAQSAGARGSNNSGVNIANQQLQARVMAEAMAQLMSAQEKASGTAGRLADATKTQTKTGSESAKPRSPALAALPFVLGQAGNIKKGFNSLGNLFGEEDTGFGSVTGGSGGFGQVVNNPSAYVAPVEVSDFISDSTGGVDLGGFSDLAASSIDAGMSGLDSILNTAGEAGLSAFDFLGFADGGLVEKGSGLGGVNMKANKRREEEAEGGSSYKPKGAASSPAAPQDITGRKSIGVRFFDMIRGYADGGMVRAGSSAYQKKTASGYADGGAVRGVNESSVDDPELNMFTTNQGASDGLDSNSGGNGSANSNVTSVDTLAEDVVSYFSQEGNNPAAYYQGKDGNFYSGQYDQSRPEGELAEGYNPQLTGIRQSGKNFTDDDYYENTPYDKVFNYDGSFQDIAINRAPHDPLSFALSSALTMAGLAMGNPALAFARGVGTRAGLGAATSFLGANQPLNAMGGTYKTNPKNPTRDTTVQGYASGGEIEGPGTGTSDSILAMVSDGEYIIPKDTVDAFGVEFFDFIKDATHTPVNMQRFHASGAR